MTQITSSDWLFTFQDGEFDQQGDADTKSEPPYDVRAKVFKEQFALADQLKGQLEFKNTENFELKKMVCGWEVWGSFFVCHFQVQRAIIISNFLTVGIVTNI